MYRPIVLLLLILTLAACGGESGALPAKSEAAFATASPPTTAPETPPPTIAPPTTAPETPPPAVEVPALKDGFAGYFPLGVSVECDDLNRPETAALVVKHFDTLTVGNEMKPLLLLDRRASRAAPSDETHPAIDPARADFIMNFAAEHDMPVRGHVLIWHNQTPHWFFREGYDLEYDTPFVSREVMIARMENYIKTVLTHFQTKYPGMIYAWDVVNEAIHPEDKLADGYRDSYWYQIIGPDYVELAFTFARQYADPGVKLFYNDFNTFVPDRAALMEELARGLREKGLLDGMGMQSHILMDFPSLADYEAALRRYCALGVEVQATEVDMKLDKNDAPALARQGERYAQLARLYKKLYDEGLPLTNVTFWGVTDDRSWLNADGASYPLLFDKKHNPKPAFWGFYGEE